MKLFQNLFGKGGIEIAAPVSGKLVAISEVNDPTFGDEILGKGVAVIPSDNRAGGRYGQHCSPDRTRGSHHRGFGCGDPDPYRIGHREAERQTFYDPCEGRRQGEERRPASGGGYRADQGGRL